MSETAQPASSLPFRKAIVIGAGSGLGRAIVSALHSIPSLSVTVLARPQSQLPDFLSTVRVLRGDLADTAFLADAFTGHDLAISCVGPAAIGTQKVLIDAAAAAGVRRFLPSEWSADTADPAVVAAIGFYAAKTEVVAHLRATAMRVPEFEWTAVVCGAWWDVCLGTGEMGLDLKGRKAVLYDGGERKVGGTTIAGVAKAVKSLAEKPEVGRSQFVYVQGMEASQKELLRALEEATGNKWAVDEASAEERKNVGWKKVQEGDFEGVVDVIWGEGYASGLGLHFVSDRELSNAILGLDDERLADVVRDAVGKIDAKHS